MEQTCVEHPLHYERDASGAVKVEHYVLAARLHVGDERCAHRYGVDVVERQIYARFMSDGRQVQGSVGRTAHRDY